MKKRILLSLFFCLCIVSLYSQTYDVKKYGARGDGKNLDSPAIQKAIDACTKAGGGKVLIPSGTYLSASIIIKDNVTLHLGEGALLLGVTDLYKYDKVDPFTDGLGIEVGRTFIAAVDAKNIAIEGKGVIDGQGSALKAKHIEKDLRSESERWGERPFLLRIVRCEQVRVEGVTLKYSASWTSHYAQSKDIVIKNVKIQSFGVAHNDGIDIDGCERVQITDCDVESGDDALCFKTTHSKYPCRDIIVNNIRLKSNQAGLKMGTESMAPFENIKISNCYIYNTLNGGIKLLTVDGAHLRNVVISDIVMDNVRTPMLFRLGSRLAVFRKGQDEKQVTGSFENVIIRNVKAKSADKTQLTSASGILITGVPGHYIKDFVLENIEIELPGGGTVAESHVQVPEAIDRYPEIKTFGPTIPAYGVWMRHVDKLTLRDITFKTKSPDMRPVIVAEDTKNVKVEYLKAEVFAGAESAVRIENSQNILVDIPDLRGESDALVEVKGTTNEKIVIRGVQSVRTKTDIKYTDGASVKSAVFTKYDWKPEAANEPIGVARGIFPGRVAWSHAPGAAHWGGNWQSMESPWWTDENTDPEKVKAMVGDVVSIVSGQNDYKKAWISIFEYHNLQRSKKKAGYKKGEIVAIKINMNSTNRPQRITNYTDVAPQTVYAVVEQLVKYAGVPEENIVIYDAKRYILADLLDKIWRDFKDVRFIQEKEFTEEQKHPIYGDFRRFELPDWVKGISYSNNIDYPRATFIPKQIMDAKYLINIAMLKAHSYPYSNMEGGDEGQTGVTMIGKNNFGSIQGPSDLHAVINTNREGTKDSYSPIVDLEASPNLGKKTILYLLDGLYCARKHSSYAVHFPNAPFFNKIYPYHNPEWPSCILASLDGVALDSVGLDILFSQTKNNNDRDNYNRPWMLIRENADGYLHEMAQADNPPSGMVYAQEEKRVQSLGVHEHWNNDESRSYSRNIDPVKGKGIELVYNKIGK